MIEDRIRCFGEGDPLMAAYHDEEWGVPVHDDRLLFEHLILDCFQAGLSWRVILNKRKNFRRAFNGFHAKKIAGYSEEDIERLLSSVGIVRNRLKIEATIDNAKAFLNIQDSFNSFDEYIWRFTDFRTLKGRGAICWEEVPTSSPESEAMAEDLKGRGFKFVGTTICYAFMQAVGMVDDHLIGCFRFRQSSSRVLKA
ncbi:MAG: DNA-3-methyladenine glycosylase [Chloroflexi bacterium RBG_16_48_8]|nr:MAG: DNA-3-methyladenine glycosylase [Chloroflexi bacterium RBG_16_48_8]